MKLRVKAPILVAVASLAIFSATGYYAYRAQFEYIDEMRLQDMRRIAQTVKNGIANQARAASNQAEFLAHLGSVREALAAEDRAALLEQLGPVYALRKKTGSAEQAAFHTPGLKVFLDLAKPSKFGEDVSGRETIVRANRYRETQAGVEVSSSGINVRAVASIDSGNVHLGSFEWGITFGRMLDRIHDNTDADLSIVVDERMIPREAARASSSEAEGGSGYKTIATTNAALLEKVAPREFLETIQDEVYQMRSLDGVEYGTFAIPFFDFAGRQIGVIAGASSMARSQQQVRAMRTTFLVATGTGVVAIAVVVFVAFRLLLLRPLAQLDRDLETFASGALDVPVSQTSRPDEIGTVSKSVDKLREKMIDEARLAEEIESVARTKSGRYAKLDLDPPRTT